ncbi:MAG: hypothetical protein E2P04_06485 [Acidobacteria bacterium]|nr:MAG: hypothetical protein E2P04_06485 [Acidobacteriota bacterium]
MRDRKTGRRLLQVVLAPLSDSSGLAWRLVALFLGINALVAVNATLHPPSVGYDAPEHLAYMATLSELRLPTPEDSAEFFSPPLSYVVPALVMRVTGMGILAAGRVAQALNVLLSLVLTWMLLQTCLLLSPTVRLRMGVLLCLGMVPVYYKTMAFVRPEPYVALFAVATLQLALRVFALREDKLRDKLLLGLALGLAVLSRQWGIFLVPAVVMLAGMVMIRDQRARWRHARALAVALAVSLVTAGWFFVHLDARYGSLTAFNRSGVAGFSFANQPTSFYLGSGDPFLFTHPVRPAFSNQALPIFYTETWGDYWCYFTVAGHVPSTGEWVSGLPFRFAFEPRRVPDGLTTNRFRIAPYLGRVNLVSLLPTTFLLLAFSLGIPAMVQTLRSRDTSPTQAATLLAFLIVAVSAVGYSWFLIQYPELDKGDTIKATYMLHVFPCLALLGGLLLERVRREKPKYYLLTVVLLAAVWAHNLPACITRYTLPGVG